MKILWHRGRKNSFTLAETLMVLSLILFLLFSLSTYHQKSITLLTENLFVSSYRRLLKLTQLKALACQRRETIFYHQKQYRVLSDPFSPVVLSPPSSFQNYIKVPVSFSATGHTKAKTLGFRTEDYIYSFIFQIGKGQFRYEEKRRHID